MPTNVTCTFSCEQGIYADFQNSIVNPIIKRCNHFIEYSSAAINGTTRFYRLAEGLSIAISQFECFEDITFTKAPADGNLFIISYDLSSETIVSQVENNGFILSRQTLLNSITVFSNALQFKLFATANNTLTRLWILVDKDWLANRVNYISNDQAEKIKDLFLQKNFGLRRMALHEAGILRKLVNYPYNSTPEAVTHFDVKAAANELLSIQIRKAFATKNPIVEISVNKPEIEKLRDIKTYVKNNIFRERPITMNELAAQFSLSESSLKRIFKKYSKTNYTDFYSEERLKKAYEIICDDNSETIQEVAHKLGYRNASYFSKAFKDTYNFYPSEIKNKTV